MYVAFSRHGAAVFGHSASGLAICRAALHVFGDIERHWTQYLDGRQQIRLRAPKLAAPIANVIRIGNINLRIEGFRGTLGHSPSMDLDPHRVRLYDSRNAHAHADDRSTPPAPNIWPCSAQRATQEWRLCRPRLDERDQRRHSGPLVATHHRNGS